MRVELTEVIERYGARVAKRMNIVPAAGGIRASVWFDDNAAEWHAVLRISGWPAAALPPSFAASLRESPMAFRPLKVSV